MDELTQFSRKLLVSVLGNLKKSELEKDTPSSTEEKARRDEESRESDPSQGRAKNAEAEGENEEGEAR